MDLLEELVLTPKLVTQDVTGRPKSPRFEPESGSGEYVKPGLGDTNKLLIKIDGALENMSRILYTLHWDAERVNGT
ncbi:hypothetical protein FRC10_000887 [Ceratobasidium sp. 414]|nr:hypothetical protein FRC10_000887 [Ceratobasidium sp. 414]